MKGKELLRKVVFVVLILCVTAVIALDILDFMDILTGMDTHLEILECVTWLLFGIVYWERGSRISILYFIMCGINVIFLFI